MKPNYYLNQISELYQSLLEYAREYGAEEGTLEEYEKSFNKAINHLYVDIEVSSYRNEGFFV